MCGFRERPYESDRPYESGSAEEPIDLEAASFRESLKEESPETEALKERDKPTPENHSRKTNEEIDLEKEAFLEEIRGKIEDIPE